MSNTSGLSRLDPRRQQHPQEREDLLIVELLTVELGRHQIRHQVVARLNPPLLDDAGQIVPQLAGGPHGMVPVARHVDDADRPSLKLPVVLFREAEHTGDHLGRERERVGGDEVDATIPSAMSADENVSPSRSTRVTSAWRYTTYDGADPSNVDS
jgi:hypothetical protein